MKKTTYIIIAVIAGIFLLNTAIVLILANMDNPNSERKFALNQKLEEYTGIADFKNVVVTAADEVIFCNKETSDYYFRGIYIEPGCDNKISMSHWPGATWEVVDSTLQIYLPNPIDDSDMTLIYGQPITITTRSPLENVEMADASLFIRYFDIEYITVEASETVTFTMCDVDTLILKYNEWLQLVANHTRIDTLNAYGWEDFDIITPCGGFVAYFTWCPKGTNQHYYMNTEDLNIIQFKWISPSPSAELHLQTSQTVSINF